MSKGENVRVLLTYLGWIRNSANVITVRILRKGLNVVRFASTRGIESGNGETFQIFNISTLHITKQTRISNRTNRIFAAVAQI